MRKTMLSAAISAALTVSVALPASASPNRPVSLSGNQWTCTYTDPEFMIHAGGAQVTVKPGTVKFTAAAVPANGITSPYLTSGYNGSLSSGLCNRREIPGSGGRHGKSLIVPVRLGQQGRIFASVHDITSPHFIGDTGFDIWLEPTPGDSTYGQMANLGGASTEIMIWLSRPGFPGGGQKTVIDGKPWRVAVGLAANGHGRTASHPNGWNVVNFISPDTSNGDVRVNNLFLNPFISYAINHGWLRQGNYLESVNQGAEIMRGTMSVAGYTLTGLR